MQRESGSCAKAYCFGVENRKRSGLSCADRTYITVWNRSDIIRGATTEELGFRQQLHVYLKPDNGSVGKSHYASHPFAIEGVPKAFSRIEAIPSNVDSLH